MNSKGRNLLSEFCENVAQIFNEKQYKEVINLEELAKDIKNEYLYIGVVGEWNTGKSTFLNKFLIGKDILPVNDTETTSNLFYIHQKREAEPDYGYIEYQPSRRRKLNENEICQDRLKEYMEDKRIKHVELCLETKWELPPEIVIVDSPGLGGFSHKRNEEIAKNFVKDKADALIVLFDSCKPSIGKARNELLNPVILPWIEKRRGQFNVVFFVGNKIDIPLRDSFPNGNKNLSGVVKEIRDVISNNLQDTLKDVNFNRSNLYLIYSDISPSLTGKKEIVEEIERVEQSYEFIDSLRRTVYNIPLGYKIKSIVIKIYDFCWRLERKIMNEEKNCEKKLEEIRSKKEREKREMREKKGLLDIYKQKMERFQELKQRLKEEFDKKFKRIYEERKDRELIKQLIKQDFVNFNREIAKFLNEQSETLLTEPDLFKNIKIPNLNRKRFRGKDGKYFFDHICWRISWKFWKKFRSEEMEKTMGKLKKEFGRVNENINTEIDGVLTNYYEQRIKPNENKCKKAIAKCNQEIEGLDREESKCQEEIKKCNEQKHQSEKVRGKFENVMNSYLLEDISTSNKLLSQIDEKINLLNFFQLLFVNESIFTWSYIQEIWGNVWAKT